MLNTPRGRCGCGEIGIRGGLKIRWGFPRCRFESDQPHHLHFIVWNCCARLFPRICLLQLLRIICELEILHLNRRKVHLKPGLTTGP
jgi:hypothetical protein